MQNLIKTKTRLAYIQFIFSTFFSTDEIIDETEHFQNYFYKLSIPSTEKDQETIVDFNKNFFTKLSFSYFEFIKKNNFHFLVPGLIVSFAFSLTFIYLVIYLIAYSMS